LVTLGCDDKHPPHADTNVSFGGRPANATQPTPNVEVPGPATDTVCEATFPNGFCYAASRHELLTDGKALSIANDEATFTVYGSSSVTITLDTSGDRRAQTVFAAANAQYFAPGSYYEAYRYPFNPFGSPGLDVSLRYTGCNMLSGKFTITEMERDAFGNFTRFAASFVQHCEYTPEPLSGVIHFNATGVTDSAPDDPSACEVASPVGFCFSSQMGHPEGYGRRVSLDEATAGFSATSSPRGRVTVRIEGNDPDAFLWQATLGASVGPLAPGHYGNSSATKNALFENPACEALAGSFDVLAIEYEDPSLNDAGAGGADGSGNGSWAAAGEGGELGAERADLRRFDVDFSYGCKQSKRELHGKLRYQKP
jgi:hypothetical protein